MAKNILIVEDEELLLNLLKKKLEELNYKVLIAKDGITGFKAIQENELDLILLDVVMPKMGGFELLEKMGEDETIKKVPVIII
ncbi:response regulator, partial [Patescibacteria group bacterium]|nr:response regulator [Patescibacteria group bacterium]